MTPVPFHARRTFLRQAAAGSLAALAAESTAAAADDPPRADGELPTHTAVWERHFELAALRCRQEGERMAAALQRPGARPLVVAACQLENHCGGQAGKQANLQRLLRAIEQAGRQGVQVIAFPELCLSGYHLDGTPAEAAQAAHALADDVQTSPHLAALCAAAARFEIVVACGFCERDGDSYYNAIGLIDADGRWLGTRRKNPLSPHPHETDVFAEPAAEQRAAVFSTRYGVLGLANCFDGEFPESIRRMRLAGAEVLLWCNAGSGNPRSGHSARINSSASYAQANRMWVVCVNAVGDPFYGTSVIVGPGGEPLVVLPPSGESLGVATIDLAMTHDWDRWRDRLDPIWQRSGEAARTVPEAEQE